MPRLALILVAALVLAGTSLPRVAAQPAELSSPLRATIVRLEGQDVYLDVGRSALEGAGALTVYRRVVVRHPLTRKALEDRFAIGQLQVVQAGDALTLARAAAAPSHPFRTGDSVEAQRTSAAGPPAPAMTSAAAPQAVAPAATQPAAQAAPAAANPEGAELLRYFQATLAQAPERRALVYEAYLARYPRSAYRGFVEQELRYLRTWQSAAVDQEAQRAQRARTRTLAAAVELKPPAQARALRPLELAALLRPEANVRSALLHLRPKGEELYRTLPMQLDGRGHARVRVPAELVRPPAIELFIEAVDDRGQAAASYAGGAAPAVIRVERDTPAGSAEYVEADAARPGMRVRFSSELASFDGTSGRDYFLINEGDFLYRVRYGRLYGVRMGYGRFDGQGGTVEQLDELELEPRPAGFTYAFLETELMLSELLGLALRGTLGLGRPDPGEHGEITGGFQTRLRIGHAEQTHLVIGAELVPEIGQRALLSIGWELIERVPMAAEVQVTDQPVNSDELAVRIVYELGYRVSERVAIALRPSYQLRTIRHAGPGVGLSATFDW